MIKNQEQIDNIIKAQRITEKALSAVLPKLKAGLSEIAVTSELNAEMMRRGADGLAFDTIVAFGEDSAEPHHVPTERELAKGDIVLIDLGAKFEGYCADMTRTFCFGAPSARLIKIFELVKNAQLRAISRIRAGMTAGEADAIAREYLTANGFKSEFCHTLGHGVGTEVHEAPRLAAGSDIRLEENMVLTVEPGLYFKGWGGVRIEDMVVVKNHGTEILTEFEKNIIIN